MAFIARPQKQHRQVWILIGLSVIAIYIILPQIGNLHRSWHLIGQAELSGIFVALGATLLTYFSAAGVYYFLAFKPLNYFQLFRVELAAMFINRLLPAGIGALGTNYAFLRHRNHTKAQAASVVGVNNFIGFAGHILLLAIILVLYSGHVSLNLLFSRNYSVLVVVSVILIGAVVVFIIISAKRRLKKFVNDLFAQLSSYRSRPANLVAALILSISLTLANTLCLAFCATALNLHISFVEVMLVFSIGLSLGTALPTPGGLGSFEAGLFAGFVAYHLAASSALALALLYRLISYWAPLLIGAPAFIICQKQKLFETTH